MDSKKVKITIAEPWDFTSSDGDNTLIVEILSQQNSDEFVVKCCSDFNEKKNHLLIKKRDLSGNYNIYGIDDLGDTLDFLLLKFMMIGKIHNI